MCFSCFIFEREREIERERAPAHKQGRSREREGDRELEAGSRLSCQHRAYTGLELMIPEIMT